MLMPVEDLDGHKLDWFQLITTETLPPVHPGTRGLIRDESLVGCPVCNRDNHFHTVQHPLELVYTKPDLLQTPRLDAVQTYECFGISGVHDDFSMSHIAAGALIVSQRVYRVFAELKVRGTRWTPVEIAAATTRAPEQGSP